MVEWLLCLWTLFLGDAEGSGAESTVSLKLDSDGLEAACSGGWSCPLDDLFGGSPGAPPG